MAEPIPNVRLNLLGTPENVVLVRGMLTGLGETVGISGSDLNDMRTAVTEACNNVVLHAYQGDPGPLELEIWSTSSATAISVRDRGQGIHAAPDDGDATSSGIGLHVIRTLTHAVEFTRSLSGGTDVRMEFAPAGTPMFEPTPAGTPMFEPTPAGTPMFEPSPSGTPTFESATGDASMTLPLTEADSVDTVIMRITPIALARGILPRVVSVLAARAHFSTDRISDAQLVADTLAAHAHASTCGDLLGVEVNIEPRKLELRAAPFEVGQAELLVDSKLDGLGSVIEKLADRHRVTAAESYETLTIGLVDDRH